MREKKASSGLPRICCFWSVLKWSRSSGVLDLLNSRDVVLNISNWISKNLCLPG